MASTNSQDLSLYQGSNLPTRINQSGQLELDWPKFLPLPATEPRTEAYIGYRITELRATGDTDDKKAALIIRQGAGIVLKQAGVSLKLMKDVNQMVSFLEESNPNAYKVDQLLNKGYKINEIQQYWRIADELRIGPKRIDGVIRLIGHLGINPHDCDEDLDLIDGAIDIIATNDPMVRGIKVSSIRRGISVAILDRHIENGGLLQDYLER